MDIMGILNITLKKFLYDRHLNYSKEKVKKLQNKKFNKFKHHILS